MAYTDPKVAAAATELKKQFDELADKRAILRAPEIKALYALIKEVPAESRAKFGAEVNALKIEVTKWAEAGEAIVDSRVPIDVTAPFDANTTKRPSVGLAGNGSIHPIAGELAGMLDIFYRMGFEAVESRALDDDYHMFESLNFPEGHPARDDYDTFMTEEGFIAPAHTSTMQNRVLAERKSQLEKGSAIRVVMPGRVFRNEDLDATHEHTFYQLEGVYVDKNVTVGNLIATLQTFMSEYFGQDLKSKTQPFYFPFTEPSLEFAIERPAILRKSNSEEDKWLELIGCGMIHPNVLRTAGINPNKYTGFAWGMGLERLIMMKNSIEDIRHFESAKLEFLRQF